MKRLIFLFLIVILSACAAEITIKVTDPDTSITNSVQYTSARRALIKVEGANVTIVTGQVTISDETAQVVIGKVADAVDK